MGGWARIVQPTMNYTFSSVSPDVFDAYQADLEAVLAFQENCDPELAPRLPFLRVSQTPEKPTFARQPINGHWALISCTLYHVHYRDKKARSKGLEPSTLASQNFENEV